MFKKLVVIFLLLGQLFGCQTAPEEPSPSPPPSQAHSQQCVPKSSVLPSSNAEIRQWYNDQIATIPEMDKLWKQEGVSAEQRAYRAYLIRHLARLKARDMMKDPAEVAALEARDMQTYGNPDGPTFNQLFEKKRQQGLQGIAIYEAIIKSSYQTDPQYNQAYGVRDTCP